MTELKPPDYLSPSSISTFQQCPLRFKLSRIDKMEELPTEATLLGNFVHDVLELLYKVPAEDRSLGVAKSLSTTVWNEYGWEEKVQPFLKSYNMNTFRWNAWWCIENLFGMEDPRLVNPNGVEHELNGKIAGVQMRGFIDRWSVNNDNEIVISDYKTGKSPAPRFAGSKFFQLTGYAHLLAQEKQQPVGYLELLFLKEGVRLDKHPTPSDFSQVEEVVVAVKQNIDTLCAGGEWEAVPTRLCDWCSYKKTICSYWSDK